MKKLGIKICERCGVVFERRLYYCFEDPWRKADYKYKDYCLSCVKIKDAEQKEEDELMLFYRRNKDSVKEMMENESKSVSDS